MEAKTKQGGKKLFWHPAFLQAMRQELFEYRDSLDFKYEYQLTSEPLRIDLLIIKKPKDLVIDKNIARIFKADNLLEYKSPDDYLSVKDYLKVYAYANLYAAITPGVDFADLSMTFIEYRHPHKLLRYLSETRGYRVEETSPGIYHVSGDYLPIQIIESGKLSERENLWLKSLTNDLQVSNVESILEKKKKRENNAPLDVFLDVLLRANPETFKEAEIMARREKKTFEEVFTEAGFIPEWLEKNRIKTLETAARNAIAKGLPVDMIHDITGLDIEAIKQLAV